MTNILHGKITSKYDSYYNSIIEWIASTVSWILANRFKTTPLPYAFTDHRYDEDLNRIEDEDENGGPYQTPTYMGPTGAIPATILERIFYMISNQAHQSCLMFHQAIQGMIQYLWAYFQVRKLRKIK